MGLDAVNQPPIPSPPPPSGTAPAQPAVVTSAPGPLPSSDSTRVDPAGDRSTMSLAPAHGSIEAVAAKVVNKDAVPVLPPQPETPAVSAKNIEPYASSKPPEKVTYTECPPPPELEKVIEVAGSGMGADKKFKMYPSELAALYSILKEKGTMSLEQMQKALKSEYGIDTEIRNGTIVNTANGHELIADTNGNGALDLGDLQFDSALKEAGIDPASLGDGGPIAAVSNVAYWSNYWADELNKDLRGSEAEPSPQEPHLLTKDEVAQRTRRLAELVSRERKAQDELLSLKLYGDRTQVAEAKRRHDTLIAEIERCRHDEMLPIVKELADFNKRAEALLKKRTA